MQVQGIQDTTRSTPLRVDAQRNLEHVLRAAREVFGELGYGAPMEDVARRARVGVGTVYRRFPSKDVLVRHIAAEETARLTEQAQEALQQEGQPWAALSRFLHSSVASGAGRLLPPQVLRTDPPGRATPAPEHAEIRKQNGMPERSGTPGHYGTPDTGRAPTIERTGENDGVPTADVVPELLGTLDPLGDTDSPLRVPQQRQTDVHEWPMPYGEQSLAPSDDASGYVSGAGKPAAEAAASSGPRAHTVTASQSGEMGATEDETRAAELLEVVGRLVARARAAGQLRDGVTVGDVLLVIATAAPVLPDASQQTAASARLLEILLAGLRSPAANHA